MDMQKGSFLELDKATQKTICDYLPDNDTVDKLATFFSIFSDHNRLRIVSALALTELCVNDLALVLNLNQTTVSHQLRTLRMAGAVKHERQGKTIFYSLASDTIKEIMLNGVDYIEPEIV